MKYPLLTIAILASMAPAFAAETTATTSRPPNFIFFMVDDMGYTDLGCYGSTFYETPNIDRLAASGMRFTSAYAACPVCSPSRAAFLTGKYPARVGVTDWIGAPQPDSTAEKDLQKNNSHRLLPAAYTPYLDLKEVTIAETLKQSGYATFIAGKWHLGKVEHSPGKQGFDLNKGAYNAGHPASYTSPYHNPNLKNGKNGEYLTDRLATETITFIADNKEKPFFVFLPFYNVHLPLEGRPDLVEKYKKKRDALKLTDEYGNEGNSQLRLNQSEPVYAAMVESVDMAVGTIMTSLEQNGLTENTVVIFTSDNGGLSTGGKAPTSNLPWRAGKGWMYEGGIREPLIIRWPGKTKPGSVNDVVTIGTDFYPTMLEMAELPSVPEQHVDGVSIASAIKNNELTTSTESRDIFWHYPHYGNQGGRPSSAIRSGDWKLIKWYEADKVELFNIAKDPYEKQDLTQANPEKVQELTDKLTAWIKSVGAKLPTPNPNYKPNN